ncbi:MAG: FGGY-family carbohydrate kinase [Rhizobiales bacterium]|nr:FGGY-family carbohydrate kinase [Hyphomicrobiales bacterium]
MTGLALGIDVGTTGVRIAAAERTGTLVVMSEAVIAAPMLDFGRRLQDPQIWWNAVETALNAALDKIDRSRVRAIAVDGTSGTILPVADDGTPLGLASMYDDFAEPGDIVRVTTAAPEISAARGASSPLARALPMQRTADLSHIIHQADWIAGQFSGRFDVTDENSALKTGYDPISRQWPSWIAGAGMSARYLPSVVPAGTRIATITENAAAKFALPEATAIVAGTTDGCAAFLASGASAPGDGVTSLGTTLTLKLLSSTPVFAPQYGIYSHRIGDAWLAGGASNSGGQAIIAHFSREEVERLTPLIDPATPTGLDYYPLARPGERFPINDPTLAPRLEPRPAEPQRFLQALLEGIAGVEALGYRRLAELGTDPLATIRTVGGGAVNDKWTEIRLKALGVPARLAASRHACAGAARLAWRGIDATA